MPQYGEKDYWNKRYTFGDVPFDWMCDWDQLQTTLHPLLSTLPVTTTTTFSNTHFKQQYQPRILIVGCGNAPFSADLFYKGGYTNQVNIDYSEVVILQQKQRYPDLDWKCMDALKMTDFSDGSFDVIIDKSLIDTTMCYKNGHATTSTLFRELHRVLKPGGRLITISLHSQDEVIPFAQTDGCQFVVTSCKLLNKRREHNDNENDPDPKTLFHTLAIFDKIAGLVQDTISKKHPLALVDAVSDEESRAIMKNLSNIPKTWDSRQGLMNQAISVDQLVQSFEAVLDDVIDYQTKVGDKSSTSS